MRWWPIRFIHLIIAGGLFFAPLQNSFAVEFPGEGEEEGSCPDLNSNLSMEQTYSCPTNSTENSIVDPLMLIVSATKVDACLNQFYLDWNDCAYKLGGCSKDGTGVTDCSNLTQNAYKCVNEEVTLPRKARDQCARVEAKHSSRLVGGDLCCRKDSSGNVVHVGIVEIINGLPYVIAASSKACSVVRFGLNDPRGGGWSFCGTFR